MRDKVSEGLRALRESEAPEELLLAESRLGYDARMLLVDTDDGIRRQAWAALERVTDEEDPREGVTSFLQSVEPGKLHCF
ncbi:hypothetical protein [Nocardia sp. NPDC002869]|uniref:hypothetical protein n=1 Tax=Nocardia sp. NPDC002869 TaxID=3161032 RepID=UPI00398D3021